MPATARTLCEMPIGRDAPPPSPEETARAFARWPDDLAGLRRAWADLVSEWQTTDARAHSLGEERAHERVADEWSYVETVRHIVFVIDLWIRRAVLEHPSGFTAAGLPPTFMPAGVFPGVDTTLNVTLDAAIQLRVDAQATVTSLLDGLDEGALLRPCGQRGEHTVVGCVKTVLNEVDLHHQFAVRDLTVLEAG